MKTNLIGIRDLRENIDKYASRVQKGEELIVMRKSKPLFKLSPVDRWGDDGVWETVVDFREIHPTGVPAKAVLAAIKKLDG